MLVLDLLMHCVPLQVKCHVVEHAQQSLERVREELRVSEERSALKDRRIRDLEEEFETKKVENEQVIECIMHDGGFAVGIGLCLLIFTGQKNRCRIGLR